MSTPSVMPAPIMADRCAERNPHAVVSCYALLDKLFPNSGLLDYTEGIYHENPDTSYEQAQRNQAEYLLDQIGCGEGSRVLDIGCGYGRLLRVTAERGGRAVGITISPEQVRSCRRRGLDVHLANYRDLPPDWNARFDAVVANGSIEHFAQPQDAVQQAGDRVYRHLFRTVHRLIDPASSSRRFVTTTIHFRRRPNPDDLLRSPWRFRWGTDAFHYALLEHGFGGWYPLPGQLERCARGYFSLIAEVDGTEDYHYTSEQWLARVRTTLRTARGARVLLQSLPVFLRHPVQFTDMLVGILVAECWNWQFRGPDPPTCLLRQTWAYCG